MHYICLATATETAVFIQALSCLVQFASTRPLFSNQERARHLGNLSKGAEQILENPQGLSDPGNYREFCRFLARLKTNYQLGELVVVRDYPEVIQLIKFYYYWPTALGVCSK